MKNLGIIGGLGPMATVYFMQLLTQMSAAKTDQEHMEIYMVSCPGIPDRTKYILGESELSPVGEMIEAGKKLAGLGADVLAIPCITAHYFHSELERDIGLPIFNAIDETTIYLESKQIKRVGILATDGTIKSGLFGNALKCRGIESIVPDENDQSLIRELIYNDIKAGKKADIEIFKNVSERLRERGAQVLILACTELSLIKRDYDIGRGYLDVMEVLAAKVVKTCNSLKKEYEDLIT